MTSRLETLALETALGDTAVSTARTLRRLSRRLRGRPRLLRYYHRVDDPRSWLYASVLGAFVDAYGLALEVEVVPEPAAEVEPEPELRARFDVEDTRRLAARFGLAFPEPGREQVAARVRMAQAIALSARAPREKLELLVQVSALLLSGKGDALAKLADERIVVSGAEVRPALEAAYARLRSLGYYAGAVVEFEGEVYPGVERLHHLERRLVAEGLPERGLAPRLVAPRPDVHVSPAEIEVFFSFRSPYSYLALAQLADLRLSHALRVVLRPVLPMVMRGLAVPRDKRLYIVRDAKREASLHGIAFGRIVDPVGVGVERCLAVQLAAEERGVGFEFALAAMTGIWSRGVDVASDAGLFAVAAEAGLDRDAVSRALADERFRAVAERNREDMYEAGLWGVPSFRVGEFATFGQDRLPLVLEAARARG